MNRGCRRPAVRAFFAAVSRAGDGSLWYALMAAVAVLDAGGGWHNALIMAITAAIGAALYKLLKTRWCASGRSFRMPGYSAGRHLSTGTAGPIIGAALATTSLAIGSI